MTQTNWAPKKPVRFRHLTAIELESFCDLRHAILAITSIVACGVADRLRGQEA
jgi:hypothetical protein